MLITLKDLPSNARGFAQYCIDNFEFRDVVEMVYADKHEDHCAQFDITHEQWQDAVYVVIKQMGK
ncbi:MAG: hypothetical protein RBR06_01880 [Desulfuromonadaceae bacterium]|nr:hypothetical protein [Desulfuromonadaceae bacterium]